MRQRSYIIRFCRLLAVSIVAWCFCQTRTSVSLLVFKMLTTPKGTWSFVIKFTSAFTISWKLFNSISNLNRHKKQLNSSLNSWGQFKHDITQFISLTPNYAMQTSIEIVYKTCVIKNCSRIQNKKQFNSIRWQFNQTTFF